LPAQNGNAEDINHEQDAINSVMPLPLIATANFIQQLSSYDWSGAEQVSNCTVLITLVYAISRFLAFLIYHLLLDRQGEMIWGKYAPKILEQRSSLDNLTSSIASCNYFLAYIYKDEAGEIDRENCLTLFGSGATFDYSSDLPVALQGWCGAYTILVLPAPAGFAGLWIWTLLFGKFHLDISPEVPRLLGAAFLSAFWYLWPCAMVVFFLEGFE
jgi:hypothetical protein